MFLLLHFQRQMNNQETAQIYDKGIFTFFFFRFAPTLSTWIILASGEQATVMIIQEVNCSLKSKGETDRLSIYLYLMLQGFCFQLWRVPGKCFLKSLIPGANLNVFGVAPGPWSLAPCMSFPERAVGREGLVAAKKTIRSRPGLSLCWNLWSEMNYMGWMDGFGFFKCRWPAHSFAQKSGIDPLTHPICLPLAQSGDPCWLMSALAHIRVVVDV